MRLNDQPLTLQTLMKTAVKMRYFLLFANSIIKILLFLKTSNFTNRFEHCCLYFAPKHILCSCLVPLKPFKMKSLIIVGIRCVRAAEQFQLYTSRLYIFVLVSNWLCPCVGVSTCAGASECECWVFGGHCVPHIKPCGPPSSGGLLLLGSLATI